MQQMNNIEVAINPEFVALQKALQNQNEIQHIKEENERLKSQLEYEKSLRKEAESMGYIPPQRQRKARAHKREVVIDDNMFNEYKRNGVKKAKAAEAIKSYDEFVKMQNYFLSRGKVRDWCLWTVGVGLGLRISDLLSLQFKNIINEDKTLKERIKIYERKTGKLNNILITDAVKLAIKTYCDHLQWRFNPDHFIFSSQKGCGIEPMAPEYGWKIIHDAGVACNITSHIGSHSMRKTFANIAACVDETSVDMNAITKIQGLLNHSDQRVTMRYLGSYQNMYDKARRSVSDFILGKTKVKDISIIGNQNASTLFSIMEDIDNRI